MTILAKSNHVMTIDDIETNMRYAQVCKEAKAEGLRPGDETIRQADTYVQILAIARCYMDARQQGRYASYLREKTDRVDLWTAHMIVEYGAPDKILADCCVDVISRYADQAMEYKLAEEEKRFLKGYAEKRKLRGYP